MITIKKEYKTPLNSETIKNIDYWLDILSGNLRNGESVSGARRQLKNYISKLAKTSFEKGLKEGGKDK